MSYFEYDVVIVGGGFFGLSLASYFAEKNRKVLVLEKDSKLMSRASLNNQARVHNGYHYPRSLLTAIRSHESYPRFIEKFKYAIVDDFEKYYAVSCFRSNITSKQFEIFCKNVDIPCNRAPEKIRNQFNSKYIEDVFTCTEVAFDSVKLQQLVLTNLNEKYCEIKTSAKAIHIKVRDEGLELSYEENGSTHKVSAAKVFNCTYSSLNEVNHNSQLPLIPLKNELTEMALVRVTDRFKDKGVTVMCGPFFSFMPFPSRGLHSFSHVSYTPHAHMVEGKPGVESKNHTSFKLEAGLYQSQWESMKRDSARYLPEVMNFEQKDSLWEIKAILPMSEMSDSRPILFQKNWGLKNYHCVLGGKIDNVFDVINHIEKDGLA